MVNVHHSFFSLFSTNNMPQTIVPDAIAQKIENKFAYPILEQKTNAQAAITQTIIPETDPRVHRSFRLLSMLTLFSFLPQ